MNAVTRRNHRMKRSVVPMAGEHCKTCVYFDRSTNQFPCRTCYCERELPNYEEDYPLTIKAVLYIVLLLAAFLMTCRWAG